MASEFTSGFSEKELDGCQNWSLPDVSSGRLIPSAEKEAKEAKKKQPISDTNDEPLDPSIGESVESVEQTVTPITAEQLQEITEAAEKEGYESGYQKGFEQAKVEGHKEGYAQGLAEAKKMMTEQCERLQHIHDALLIPLQTEQQQLESIILDMICKLTEAVVLRELKTDSSHITTLVDAALNTIPVSADKFALYLNSQDIDVVEKYLDNHPQSIAQQSDKPMTYHIDNALMPGGCRLETRQTVVDYTIEQRLQKVIDDFLHKRFADYERSQEAIVNDDETEQSQIAYQEKNKENIESIIDKPESIDSDSTEVDIVEAKTEVIEKTEAEKVVTEKNQVEQEKIEEEKIEQETAIKPEAEPELIKDESRLSKDQDEES